eukprot:CAMPEP_0194203478 /NCGR_PEP_ID=MMETSP0156-20130528/3235_1 /TAXON_ID=33649 /ORGANISM="Thalassionema nitzschioides, Strain L26-B" /LENGTH=389 /DNA_ID=CAMNT_0038929231 /DNA_START=98 /DNA_END=1267 /DNA_ORIENTATION=-
MPSSSSSSSLLHLLLGLLWLLKSTTADKDQNVYPWGDNPNNRYKMYWKDSINVLNDLDEFSSLHIKVHGCIWSEYGLGNNYDDDGENHDGDENWYMTRVQPFRANAAFSLYGFLKSSFNMPGRGSCRKATYINTFFTYEGADSILSNLGKSVDLSSVLGGDNNNDDDGYSSAGVGCYEAEYDDYYYAAADDSEDGSEDHSEDRKQRELSSNSQDNDNSASKTLGCTADGAFAIAKFQGEDCDGRYFLNTTQDDMSDYNHAMESLHCAPIYKGSDTSLVYSILSTSFACDIALYGTNCPDPYDLKHQYDSNTILSSKMGRSVVVGRWQTPVRILTMICFVAGIVLLVMIGFMKNPKLNRKFRKLVKKKKSKKKKQKTAADENEADGVMKT